MVVITVLLSNHKCLHSLCSNLLCNICLKTKYFLTRRNLYTDRALAFENNIVLSLKFNHRFLFFNVNTAVLHKEKRKSEQINQYLFRGT